jgi:hypothetical protein
MAAVAAAIILAVIGAGAYWVLSSPSSRTSGPEMAQPIEIQLKVDPPTAHIYVDGMAITVRPPVIKAAADGRLRIIGVKAEGYESKEQEVRFDATKTISVALAKIEVKKVVDVPETDDTEPRISAGSEEPSPISGALQEQDQEEPEIENEPSDRAKARTTRHTEKSRPKKGKIGTAAPARKKASGGKKTRDGFSLENPFN